MNQNDTFSASIGMSAALKGEKDLAPKYPTSNTKAGGMPKYTARYAKFTIEEDGCKALEAIMDDCLLGKKLLAEEKWHFTKEGDAVVIIKYLVPASDATEPEQEQIAGRRRQRKALERKL